MIQHQLLGWCFHSVTPGQGFSDCAQGENSASPWVCSDPQNIRYESSMVLASGTDTEQVCDVILLFKEFSTEVEYQMDTHETNIDL